MEKQYYADTVDENGVVHETVGENIRNGAKEPDSITNSFVENDDKVKFLDNMHISANYFKYALLTALTGQRIDYGYTFFAAFTDDQKQQIKNWLGVTEPFELTQEEMQSTITSIANFGTFLNVDANSLKKAIIQALSGDEIEFNGSKLSALTEEEKTAIQVFLEISVGG